MRIRAIAFGLSLGLVQSCGGSTPEPATPEKAAPSESEQPASEAPALSPAPAPGDQHDLASEGDESYEDSEVAPKAAERAEEPSELSLELGENFDALAEALNGETPDCAGAERFREEVCRLAARICDLTDDLPSSSKGHARCDDGRKRCDAAKRRYSDVCG